MISQTASLFLLQLSLIAVVLILHTYLGLHIVRRTLIFCDLVLAQLAALGTLIGVALQIKYGSPLSYALSFGSVLLVFHYGARDKFIALAQGHLAPKAERIWDFLFFTTQGTITVLIVPVAGVLLAYAFMMVPASIAAMFTRTWGRALGIGWLVGFVAYVMDLGSSYLFSFPYGPSLVLSLGAFFLGAVILRCLSQPKGAY